MDIVERLTLEAAQAETMIACEHRHRYEFAAGLVGGLRVLDLCCGSGYGSEILAAAAAQVTGVDRDVATIDAALAGVGAQQANVAFEAADAVEFLHGDLRERFDVIVCFEGLEHLEELEQALSLLQSHAMRGVRLLASVPNDRLTGVRNPHHVTQFGYDEAMRAFARFAGAVMVPQFLAEGSLILPAGAEEPEVTLRLGQGAEPEYANHFIFCVGFDPGALRRVHHGRLQASVAPVFNRWSEDLKHAAWGLRRENARLARERLGMGGSAAAAAVRRLESHDERVAGLEHELGCARERVRELEAQLLERDGAAPIEALEAAEPLSAFVPPLLEPGPDGNPNSWEMRRRRAAEVLIPWIERTVTLAGRTVLEFGCGNGAVSCALAERAGRVLGLDIDPEAIAEGRARLAERGTRNVELEHHPRERVLAAARAHTGEIDVVALYAVLEHMSVGERLELLRLARELVRPDGAIVVCETPNRLIYFDHHTAQMPFFHLLPDELALELHRASARGDFSAAIEQAARGGREAALEAIGRWGRGVSFHEFQAAFGERFDEHVIATGYDPLLLGERPVHPEEAILARYLQRQLPQLGPAWSRYWLDLILSPAPVARRPPLLRPWIAETTQSAGVAWTAWENLRFLRAGSRLAISLPQPTTRLLVGSVSLDGQWVTLTLRAHGSRRLLPAQHRAPAGRQAFSDFALEPAAQQLTLEALAPCHVVLIAYEA